MADNFLEYPNWFDETFEIKLRNRYWTFRTALNLLYQLPTHYIVETGCTIRRDDWGSGNSTAIFGSFVNRCGGYLTTIDINADAIKACKKVTSEYSGKIGYVLMDSLLALKDISNPIDLLYLDSMDAPIKGNATNCQKHNLKEFKLAEPLLHDKSIVLIDDNDMENGGKSRLTKVYLAKKDYKLILNNDQSLWMK